MERSSTNGKVGSGLEAALFGTIRSDLLTYELAEQF